MQFNNPASTKQTVLSPGSAVTITGGSTSQAPPAGTPTLAIRTVSVASVASASNANAATSTLIAAPVAPASIELHALSASLLSTASSAGGATTRTLTMQLQRSDNNAVLWQGVCSAASLAANAVVSATSSPTLDFEGATLPAGVGVNLVTTVSGTGQTTGQATLTYNVVT